MKDKKKLLNVEELEQVAGGAGIITNMIDPQTSITFACKYCNACFSAKADRDEHEKVCPENPDNKATSRALL